MISINFNKKTILILLNAKNQTKSTVESGYMCLGGLYGPPAVTFTK